MVSRPQIHANCSFRIPSAARIAVSLEEGNASEGTSTPSCLASLSTTLMPLITLGSGGGGKSYPIMALLVALPNVVKVGSKGVSADSAR